MWCFKFSGATPTNNGQTWQSCILINLCSLHCKQPNRIPGCMPTTGTYRPARLFISLFQLSQYFQNVSIISIKYLFYAGSRTPAFNHQTQFWPINPTTIYRTNTHHITYALGQFHWTIPVWGLQVSQKRQAEMLGLKSMWKIQSCAWKWSINVGMLHIYIDFL